MSSIIMATLGASTAAGRILFGRILQKGYLDRLRIDQLTMVMTGTGVMMLPLCRTFGSIIAYVCIAGVVDGCYVVLLPTLTEAFTGEDKKVLAWGVLNLFGSITFTLGPPVAGWLYDVTGSYNLSFHVAGIPIIFGAILLFFIPWAQRTSHTTNVMTAVQSSDDVEGIAANDGAEKQAPANDTVVFASKPISIQPGGGAGGGGEQDVITIRSAMINEKMSHKSRGSFLLVDLDNRCVMTYAQNPRDNDTSGTPVAGSQVSGILAKAIDVLKHDSTSVMSLTRTANALDAHGRSVEYFQPSCSVTSNMTRQRPPLISQSPRSVDFCLPSVHEAHSALKSPTLPTIVSPASHRSRASTPDRRSVTMSFSPAPKPPLTSPPHESDDETRYYAEVGRTEPVRVRSPSVDSHFRSTPSSSTLTSCAASGGRRVCLTSPGRLSSSRAQASRDRGNTVEGGDNPRARDRPRTPPNERDDVMFVMSDISLSDPEPSNSQLGGQNNDAS